MAVKPEHTLGFLAGGYRNVAKFKGIELENLPQTPPKYSSLLIGWDAADWEVMMPFLKKGAMPECVSLMNGAVRANLATLDPPISPMLWTSIATSTWPSVHGIHGFTEIINGEIRAVRGSSIKVPTMWDHLEAAGVPSTIVGWWPSHPAKDSAYAALRISNLAASEDARWLDEGVSPKGHSATIEQLLLQPEDIPATAIAAFFPGIDITGKDAVARSVLKIVTHALNVQIMATYALEQGPGGHASIYFDALDHFMHLGMKYAPPKLPSVSIDEFKNYQFIVEAAYRLHDLCLGTLRNYKSDDGYIMLVSDHGFKSGPDRPVHLPDHAGAPALEHRHYGVFILNGPNLNTAKPTSGLNLLDVAPILLRTHSLEVPEGMCGLVPANLLPEPKISAAKLNVKSKKGKSLGYTDEVLLQTLIDLGYLDENHTATKDGRLLENRYYLARSLRAEGRPEWAWQIMREMDLGPNAPLRYHQLAASLLAESGQYDELAKIIALINQRGENQRSLMWQYYQELVNIKRGRKLNIPQDLLISPTMEERVLWGNLLVKAGRFDVLEKLLSSDTEESVDLLNLRIRLSMHNEDWEGVLDDALKSTSAIYHQPWVHGALVSAFTGLGMHEEAAVARRIQRKLIHDTYTDPLFIVTGPPRSGTSLAMRLLDTAGVPSVTDGVRKRDKFNALGYYEHEKIKNWDFDEKWLANSRGKAVKIVEPLLIKTPWPSGKKVVVRMNRPLPTVMKSQRNMMGNEDAPMRLNEMSEWEKERRNTLMFLQMDPNVELIELHYDDLIAAAETDIINERLSMGLLILSKYTEIPVDISIVKAVVEPELRRF